MSKATLIVPLALIVAAVGYHFAIRKSTPKQTVAEIINVKNSVRTRAALSLKWEKAFAHETLAPNDAVYTEDDSTARIILKHGAALELSENSLLEINGQEIPHLEFGNLRLSLQGNLKFSFGSRQVALHGQDSEIQIFIEQGRGPRLRLLSGSASLQKFALQKGKVASLDKPDLDGSNPILNARAGVETVQESNEFFHKDKIDDLYQKTMNGAWTLKKGREPMLEKSVTIHWKVTGLPAQLYVQLANTRDFKQPLEFIAQGEQLELKKVFFGNNFWRVSVDKRNWNEAYFKIETLSATSAPPALNMRSRRLPENKNSTFPIESADGYRAYLVDVSPTLGFEDNVETTWLTDATFLLTARKAGEYFLRVRGVNANSELSEPSRPEKITVEH